MSVHIQERHIREAEKLVAKTRANNGLAPLDLKRFWKDDAQAKADPWAADCPQVPLGIGMGTQCFWTELGEPENWYEAYHNHEFRVKLARCYNDLAQKIVGKRLLNETLPDPNLAWPACKALHDFFEAENKWEDMSYWLEKSADTPDELEALLDRVEARLADARGFMLPAGWDREKARLTGLGTKPQLYRHQRGPVTFAMSVYGVENLIYLIFDRPELAARFSSLILQTILERAMILDEEAGYTPETAPHGWWWNDDNCAMLNAEMYDFFAKPIMNGVYGRYSPDPEDRRGQHSDSDMAQHLPTFAEIGMNVVNFGPNLTVAEIREHLPRAVIAGQLAPFTFSRNEEVNMVAEFLRDFEMAQERKGLVFTTAGSINDGSRLTGLRLIMAAIQEYGRYA